MSRRVQRPPKASVVLARHIVEDIRRRRLQAGDRLGSERDLIGTYDVGRSTLREALRILEVQGCIDMRAGPTGGPVVTRPTSSTLAGTLSMVLQHTDTSLTELVTARATLAGLVLSHVAVERDEAVLDALDRCVDDLEAAPDQSAMFVADRAFVDGLSRAAGNDVYAVLLKATDTIVRDSYRGANRVFPVEARVRMYRAAVHAARRGDAPRARDVISRWGADELAGDEANSERVRWSVPTLNAGV